MRGMTGFGRSSVRDARHEVTVEVSSVNKRHLDVVMRLPRGYQRLETSIRRQLATYVVRGQLSLSIEIVPLQPSAVLVPMRYAQVDGQMGMLGQMADHVGVAVPTEKALIELWRRQLDMVEEQERDVEAVEQLVHTAVGAAVDALNLQRTSEGCFIGEELLRRVAVLREIRDRIAQGSVDQVDRIRERLTALVARYVPSLAGDDRVLREVVLYVDKADVSEELSRIDHHLGHFERCIAEENAIGKTLEFLLQELQRELNTLGAKTTQAEVSTAVVMAKTELEKMREQVQNVE